MSSQTASPPAQIRPRGIAFLIPVGIFLAGIVVMVLLIINGFRRADQISDDFDRVSVGESATFSLEEGSYRVWIEGPGVDEGFELIDYTIVSADDGTPVTTSPYSTSLNYSSGDRSANAFETFDLGSPGEYEVSFISTSSGSSDRNLAIGQDNPVGAIGAGFGVGILAAVIGLIVAVIITIVFFVKRGRAKRAQAGPRPPAGGYGYGYGYPSPGYPGQQPPPQGYPPQGYPPQPQGYPQPQQPPPPPPPGYPPPPQQPPAPEPTGDAPPGYPPPG